MAAGRHGGIREELMTGETSPLPGREEGLRGILRGIRSFPSLETLEQGMGKDGP